MPDRSTRRRFLSGVLATSTIAIAGCTDTGPLGGASETTQGGSKSANAEASPEQVTRQFIHAVANANQSKIDAVSVGTAPADPDKPVDVSIERVERTSLSDAIDAVGHDANETEIDEFENTLESSISEEGGNQFAVVEFQAVFEEAEQSRGYIVLTRVDGEWRVYDGLERLLREYGRSTTSDESTADVTEKIVVQSIQGVVQNETVTSVRIAVTLAPEADAADVRRLIISWIGPNGSRTFTYSDTSASGSFSIEAAGDEDGSIAADGKLNGDDMADITINLGNDASLPPGTSAALRLTTPNGATTEVVLDVPDSLTGKETVAL